MPPEQSCEKGECELPSYVRGLCRRHYFQSRKMERAESAEDRCEAEGCSRKKRGSLNLCIQHGDRVRKGLPLEIKRPTVGRGITTLRDEIGRKRCTACGIWEDLSAFDKRPRTADRLNSICRLCARCKYYGIARWQYEKALHEQGGKCGICLRPPLEGDPLVIDHDHACCPGGRVSCGACFRGLLCKKCNHAIGLLGEDPVVMNLAIRYVTARKGAIL